MIKKIHGVSLLALMLTACGGQQETTEPDPAEDIVEIEVHDEPFVEETAPAEEGPTDINLMRFLGSFDGEVTDLAIVQDPSVSGRGTLFAANGEAGVAIIQLGDGVEPSSYVPSGRVPTAIAATLAGENTMVAIETVANNQPQIDIMTLTEDRNGLVLVASAASGISGTATALCFSEDIVFRVSDSGVVTRHEIIPGTEVTLEATLIQAMRGATTCASTGNKVFTLSAIGQIQEFDQFGTRLGQLGLVDATENVRTMTAYSHQEQAIIGLIRQDGQIYIGDQTASFSYDETVFEVADIIVSPGNYGGPFSEGIAAVLSMENDLALVSWLSIANSFELLGDSALGTDSELDETLHDGFDITPTIELPELDLSTEAE